MRYRTRAEIVSQMLQAAKEDLNGVTKTKIMYCTSLSFLQSKEYMHLLLDRQLLEHDKSKGRYLLTQKGIEYLELFEHTK
ncbi:MAG TPA: winged helix-turn-helix domain-containing protein, partial [Nitrososphaera sp.]|nr:winged helix-turn-helix domain-containing protein [Nitrososphaera sp.]